MNLAPLTPGTTWWRIRLALRRDPRAHITSAIDAIRLADQVLTGASIAHAGTKIWSNVAVEPLAALILTASAVGTGDGMSWVRDTSSALHHADDDDAWDRTQTSCTPPRSGGSLVSVIAQLRALAPRQRRSVTQITVTAAGPRPRREGAYASRRETSPRPR